MMVRSIRPFSPLTLSIAVLFIINLYYFSTRFGLDPLSALDAAETILEDDSPEPSDATHNIRPPPPPISPQPDIAPTRPTPVAAPSSAPAGDAQVDIASLPAIYHPDPHETGSDKKWCETRYGPTYLETLAKNARPYCTESSRSQFDCMHSVMQGESRRDSFCLAQNVAWDDRRFNIDCELRDWNEPDLQGIPQMNAFNTYWYDTGPRNILTQFVNFGSEAAPWFDKNACADSSTPRDDSYKVLIKREGGTNYWHSLMEIFSFYFSIDALQMAINKKTGKPYMSPEDTAKIQVLILDKHDNKNYFELWNLFADKPVQTLPEWASSKHAACLNNVIIPLPGASNPLWQGDWDPRNCDHSVIVDTLRTRILSHLKIPTDRDLRKPLNLTFIDRKGSRKLSNSADLTAELIKAYPKINVNIVDMAKLTLREQINIVAHTDVLVGVHGAGHTHGFFLPAQSSVVEILPIDLKHKGFRNLAALRGLRYFSDHAPFTPSDVPDGQRDWHEEDVVFDKRAFMKLVDAAIQSVAHRGYLDEDVS
ncbi:hypothetical protein H072_6513 [Dactylellina haptotyla CBS 200.50]|uniref:EGF domain-specific O-linked N-acetylglucosamine transferase n=1 Tax=Dactylellina haptotyla (strain CBS 200.50) TaxID=1284197 RepID=S8BK39_DACHA|nr:hypothetical protein H072_6513 [Dactylellina haptotyla CBS 200.50]